MGRPKDSGRLDLRDVFVRVQEQMLAQLAVDNIFEHASSLGAATELQWIALFNQYLPQRYRASRAFIIDAHGRRSRQIDIAVYDNLYSPLLFPHDAGFHIPAESVYAVFEVKQRLTRQLLRDAAVKVASVRRLHRTSVPVIAAGVRRPALALSPILAGVLAVDSVWRGTERRRLPRALQSLRPAGRLDLGCILQECSFERRPRSLLLSHRDESLIFFLLHLLRRLRALGTAPAADLAAYAQSLRSTSLRL
ncbi:MAG TPA: DUF6602 domain-containing protein [Bryobacterales bacterium]|nr:DUF6602 domain-containing protein [Bryobacterales bacterium]